jgi:predicted transcriptional regulator of viral defense system
MLNQSAKERVARRAGSQFGRISWAQLVALGADRRTIHDWTQTSYLHRVLPGVYAVGHAAPSTEADLAAAVLYAGPGAMLSHATAAWWLGLVDAQPRLIEVSTPRRCLSRRGIHVHQRRTIDRIWRRRLPVTSLVQTLIDYASAAPRIKLRRALAQVDYHQGVDVAAIEAG